MLVHLSKADNYIDESESKMLHFLGKVKGLTENEVEMIIDNPLPIGDLIELAPEEKFEYLFSVIQMMKIDGKVFKCEIDYCKKIADKLGYKPSVIADLSAYIYSDPEINTKKSFLKSIADEHLMSKKEK